MEGSETGPRTASLFLVCNADDIILLGDTTASTQVAMLEVLNTFCEEPASLRINSAKSQVLFSKNTKADDRRRICSKFNVEKTTDLGKYLGFPISMSWKKEKDFSFVIEKCSALPAKTLETLDKINRNFPWGSTEEKKKIHLVGRDVVRKPKLFGGLDAKRMKPRNESLVEGMLSRSTISDAPWARIIRHKFLHSAAAQRCKASTDVRGRIRGTPQGFSSNAADRIVWGLSQNGRYNNTKSAYLLELGISQDPDPKLWSWIWKCPTIPRIQHFIWLVSHGKLPTACLLAQRGMAVDTSCSICSDGKETIDHILRNCLAGKCLLTLCSRLDRIIPKHAFREANGWADILVRMGSDQMASLAVFTDPPPNVVQPLFSDIIIGVASPRMFVMDSG
ncbi:hypothetical protein CRG98_024209 [Punica granatum]|uniref:Reverse transcriptase zinc-binding domain-containing protein n=1 Tax=Punica granatum TaxID=22663 RepID=A0A2I0JIF9_PUNGR|nr:hypothetical protein CRG98_024209 [Punica granatum]